MTLTEQLITVADVFCADTGRGRGTVSAIILKNGGALAQIAEGRRDITTKRFESSIAWFSANWPDDLEWPEGITRPAHRPAPVDAGLAAEASL